jgi:hypothetical protein
LRSVVEELGVVKFIKRVDLELAAAFCVFERNIWDLVGIGLHKKQVFECHVLLARLVIVVQDSRSARRKDLSLVLMREFPVI